MAEIATAVAAEAAAQVAEPLLARVRRQCEYVIFSDRYVGQLDKELQKLKNAMARVRHSVDEALYDMKLIEADVENWVKEAETVAKKAGDVLAHKARDVLDDEGRAKKTCFCGWLLNPKARYCLGRDASKTVEAIPELIRQGKFDKVYYENAPPGLVGGASNVNSSACDGGDTIQELIARGQFENPPPCRVGDDGGDTIQELTARGQFENPPTVLVGGASGVNSSAGDGGDFITGSRASIFQGIMKALDDEKLKVIGVYGPGGVGKTTLLAEVEKKLKKEGRPFRMIVKAKVSQTQDLNKIQDDIAYFFGLKLKEPSEEGRRDLLCRRLEKDPREKILIILDDLWDKLDMKAVGIPLGGESRGCKLLLTSRYKDVLEQKMLADRTFLLQGLEDDEAFRLFEKIVGDKLKDEELKAIAAQVVKKLAGLPLLITSVARTLRYTQPYAWRNALIQIEDSDIKSIVKLSYDHLTSEDAKSLFLLCGLIGGTIPVELLLVLAMGLGLFQRFNKTMPDLRDRLNNMLDELRSACLLLEGGDDKDNVTIHDLYSEVVVSTPFQDQNSLMMSNNYGASSKEELEKCWAICLDDAGIDRLAELMPCQFPSLKILMLSMRRKYAEYLCDVRDRSKLLDFKDMKELRVLYLHFMHITNLPPSIKILENLRSLYLYNCKVEDVAIIGKLKALQSLYLYNCKVEDVAIIGKLKALQSLSFTGSTISRLPEEMGELTNLRLLNLNDCEELQRIEPGVLKRLIKLEELHMKRSFDRWMGKNEKPSELCNAGLAELRIMTKLNSLEILICDPIILLEVDDLPFENLTRFWINIGNAHGKEFKCLRTIKIKLEGHDSILSKTWVQKTLQKTQYLHLDGLGEFENNYELCIQGFLQLKHLEIQNSPSIKYIASSSNSAFAILESLFLNNLINLENIYHGHISAECFSKLKDVTVEECNRLEYLWSLSHMQNFVQLKMILVGNCNSMRAIARKDTVLADCRVELPYLYYLYLADLPNMRSFCSRDEMTSEGTPIQVGAVDEGGGDEGTELVTTTSDLQNTYSDSFFDRKASLQNLEDLWLDSAGSFKRIWQDELSRNSFCKLDTITCENCSDLLHIFPSTIIGRLHNLKLVKVKNCPSLKSLFDFGSLDSNTEQNAVLLPKLERFDIESCPSLESLFNCGSIDSNAEHKIILLPKLKKVRMSGAKKLRHVVMSHSQIFFGFPSLETIIVENCSDLRYLFPKYTATTLEKLKWLEITKCKQMKEVILEKEAARSQAEVMSFPWLDELTLKELDNLISFSSGSVKRQLGETAKENDESPQSLFNEMVTFPNMKNLNIESVGCKELWSNHVLTDSSVCSHRFLSNNVKVKNCPSLKLLFRFGSLDSNTEQNAILLPKLESIDVESCPSLESLFDFGSDSNTEQNAVLLPKLESIDVESCPSMESLFNCGSLDSNAKHKIILLPKLEKVRVSAAKKLRHVVMSHSQIVLDFPSLEIVSVENCSNLRYLFPKYTAATLEELKWLKITKCEQMKEVILEKEVARSEAVVMSFPCLSELTLKELDNLISFSSESVKRQLGETAEENDESPQPLFNEMVTFPNMRNLNIEGVACKELWNIHVLADSSVCSHQFLSNNVEVKNRPSLKSSFGFGSLDSNMEQNTVLLPKLESIDVESCPSLESLFNCGSLDSNAEHKIILLPKLEKVRVSEAKKLRHVVMSHSQIVFGFPSLETIIVENCSDLRYLFPKYTATTLEKLKWLEITKCKQMKEVILEKETARSQAEVMSFPWLDELTLKELDSLISFSSGSVKRQLGETAEENDESSQPLFNDMVTFPNMRSLNIDGVACKELWNNHVLADSSVCSHRFLSNNVKVRNCPSLKSLFGFGSLDSNTEQNAVLLHELESINVENCPSLKSLFDFGSLDSNTEQNAVLLPKLAIIEVESCPSLESLFNCGALDSNAEHKIISLPNLDRVWVSGAKKLRHLVMSHSQIVFGFPSLRIVGVENCSDLRYLFLKNTATTLEKLWWLEITKCEQMKEVILDKEVARSEAEVMSFPCLSVLKLIELDNLISFSSGSVKRQLGETAEENDEPSQPLFNDMVTFPNMISLNIDGVACKELWNNHVLADSSVCSHRFLSNNVKVRNCPSLKSLFGFGSLDSNTEQNVVLLHELESIDVENCPSLESLFNCGSLYSNAEHKIILLPKLKEVSVSGAKKLRHMVMSHSQIVLGFPSLEIVSVENCSDLRYLFPKYMAITLEKLRRLEITKCEQMKEVILEKEATRSQAEVMSFLWLDELTLKELDNLISFSSGSVKRQLGETAEENDESSQPLFNEMVTFPNITCLEVKGLRCKELWNNQIPTNSFQKLESLVLENCDNLQCIATPYMWKKLQRCLKELGVISCHLIEIIYEGDATDTESGKLTGLALHDLKNLRCIWQSDSFPNIPFPNLRLVNTMRCPRLAMIFPTFTAKFLGQIELLVAVSCEDMEQIAGHEKWEEVTGTAIIFSKLTKLILCKLPKFKSFLPEKCSLKFPCSEDFPSLQVLRIESCGAEPDQVLNYREDSQTEDSQTE